MGWNGSGDMNAAPVPKKKVRLPPSKGRGLIALVIVVALGGVALWFFTRPAPDTVAQGTTRKAQGTIASVTPHIATQAVEEVDAPKPKPKQKEKPYWLKAETNGLNEAQLRKWEAYHRAPPCITNDTALTQAPPEYAIFNHASENRIAAYLTLKPGQGMVGTPIFDDRFEEDFLKSCEEPIIISEDDSEQDRELKKQMNEVKIELRARMRNGEKLSDIMRETHAEAQRLSEISREVQAMAMESIKKSATTEADADLVIEAANKMLDEKGVAPIRRNPIVDRQIRRAILKNSQN